MSDTLPPLLPCPFCGQAHTMKLTTAQELAEEGEDDPEPWMHSDSFGVLCDASRPGGPGGCGASGGFFPSEREAVDAWNRRAALAAAVAEPVASVTECEACFTPDVCQLRGTCDHYAAERLRVAAPPQREPYDQTALGLCNACGWKAVGPDGCLNCAPQREPQWVPIETAPKDGAEVWAYNGEQARMKWIEGDGYALWVWADDTLNDIDPNPQQPTHWMPLPPAPKSA